MRDEGLGLYLVAGILLIVFGLAWCSWYYQRRTDCEQSGGRVVEVQGNGQLFLPEWTCVR